jgi:hypothetical protein
VSLCVGVRVGLGMTRTRKGAVSDDGGVDVVWLEDCGMRCRRVYREAQRMRYVARVCELWFRDDSLDASAAIAEA